jgi:hypothetical protein
MCSYGWSWFFFINISIKSRLDRDYMVVGFTTICVYHHKCCAFESRSWRGTLDATLCDQVCQWQAAGRWFSLGTPVSSTIKTERHDRIIL